MIAILISAVLTSPFGSQIDDAKVDGVRTVTFPVPEGKVRVYLPSDMSAGDTITGTVIPEPDGKTPADVKKNEKVLSGYVVSVGETKQQVGQGARLKVEKLPGVSIPVVLSSNGKPLGARSINLLPIPAQPRSFHLPNLGQSGHPVQISGPFDGDMSNTNVRIGSTEAPVLTESPRNIVVTTNAPPGPTVITVCEAEEVATGRFRYLKIDLTTPKKQLLKGESTEVKVAVSGLEGLSGPVPIKLTNQTPQNIRLDGGDIQTIPVMPSDTGTSGTASYTRGITATSSGGFRIDARILYDVPPSTQPPPAPDGFKNDPTDPDAVVPDGAEADKSKDKIGARKFRKSKVDVPQNPNDDLDDRKWQSSDPPEKAQIGEDIWAWFQKIFVISYVKNGVTYRGTEFPVYFKWQNKHCVPGHWEQIVKSTVWVGANSSSLKKAKAVVSPGPPPKTEYFPAGNDAEVAGKWEVDTNAAGKAAKDPAYPNQDKGEMLDSPQRGRASLAGAYSSENPKEQALCVKELVEFYTFWIGPDGKVCAVFKWSFWSQWEISPGDDPLTGSGMANANVTGGCDGPTSVDKDSVEGKAAQAARDGAIQSFKG